MKYKYYKAYNLNNQKTDNPFVIVLYRNKGKGFIEYYWKGLWFKSMYETVSLLERDVDELKELTEEDVMLELL